MKYAQYAVFTAILLEIILLISPEGKFKGLIKTAAAAIMLTALILPIEDLKNENLFSQSETFSENRGEEYYSSDAKTVKQVYMEIIENNNK